MGLEAFLEPLFVYWRSARRAGEGFGDFSARVGFDALRAYAATYVPDTNGDMPKVRPAGANQSVPPPAPLPPSEAPPTVHAPLLHPAPGASIASLSPQTIVRPQVPLPAGQYEKLAAAAAAQGKSLAHLASEQLGRAS